MHDFLYLNAAFGLVSRPAKKRQKSPHMIRMTEDMHAEILALAKTNNTSMSAIIRMAVEKHLPAIRTGRAVLRPGR